MKGERELGLHEQDEGLRPIDKAKIFAALDAFTRDREIGVPDVIILKKLTRQISSIRDARTNTSDEPRKKHRLALRRAGKRK